MANISYQGTLTSTPDPGIATTETNYDVKGWGQDLADPRILKTDDEGTPIGFWSGHQTMVTIRMEGEVASALNAIPTIKLAETSVVPASNLFTMDAISAGGVYHDTSSVTQAEAAIATFTTTATRHRNIA